jgi:hypothetical protein
VKNPGERRKDHDLVGGTLCHEEGESINIEPFDLGGIWRCGLSTILILVDDVQCTGILAAPPLVTGNRCAIYDCHGENREEEDLDKRNGLHYMIR